VKIHRHLVHEIVVSLSSIFKDLYYADKVIERALKNHPKWGSRDRRFFAETVYEIVRNWRLLWFCLGREISFQEKPLMELFRAHWFLQKNEILEMPELSPLDAKFILNQRQAAKKNIAIEESYPDWMYQLIKEELENKADLVLRALNQRAEIVLRANLLKTQRDILQKKLEIEGVLTQKVEGLPEALKLTERKNVFITKAFKEGLFEMQDGSSQKVVPFMKIKSGMRIVDACAGAGGKTLHIASHMQNKGKVIAMDIEERKLIELKRRLKRAGVDIVEARLIDSTKVIKRLEGVADRVLLDAPCSGLGVLRRNPDSKWKMTLERIEELKKIQKNILQDYSSMVKRGGYLIYATCSILPSENKRQVDQFLKNNQGNWEFEEDLSLLPHQDKFDGFYMARLKRL